MIKFNYTGIQVPIGKSDHAMHVALHLWAKGMENKFKVGDIVKHIASLNVFEVARIARTDAGWVYQKNGSLEWLDQCNLELVRPKVKETKMEKHKTVEWCEKNLNKGFKYLITPTDGKYQGFLRWSTCTNTWMLIDWGPAYESGMLTQFGAGTLEGCYVRPVFNAPPGLGQVETITYPDEVVTIKVSRKALDEAKALVASGRGDIELSALDGFLSELKES
jgi:hypothetical protein